MGVQMRHILAAWLLITGVLAGCSRAAPDMDAPLLASRWLLTAFTDANGRHPVPTDPIPYLEVDEDSLWFHNGCNGVGSSWHMEDGQIAVEGSFIRGVGCDPHFDAAEALLDAVADSMAGWATYTLQGDDLIIPFAGGEARFTRAIPPNAAGLRAFPVQRGGDVEPTYDDSEGLLRGPILLEDGCLRIGGTDNFYSSYLIIWPAGFAAAFDDQAAWATWLGWEDVRVGDEVVMHGGRLLEIEPLLDAEVLRLDSIPNTCAGPYWVVEDVLTLDE